MMLLMLMMLIMMIMMTNGHDCYAMIMIMMKITCSMMPMMSACITRLSCCR